MVWPNRNRWALAAPFLVLGLWCLLGWGRRVDLHCQRGADKIATCALVSRSLLTTERKVFDGALLETVAIEEESDVSEDGTVRVSRRVVLELPTGREPISSFGAGGSDELLAQVRDFNFSRRPGELQVSADSRWFAYPMALLWLGFGGWLLRRDR